MKFRLYLLAIFLGSFSVPLAAQSPQVVSLTLDRSEMVGNSNQTTTATVTVSPAPTVNTQVSTSCGGAGITFFNCPGNVVVQAGETTATFTFQVGFVSSPKTAVIRATLVITAEANLTVNPPTHSVTVNPGGIIGASTQSATVTITLDEPVRQGGTATFTVSRNPTSIILYDFLTTVHIGGGETTASFTFQTGTVVSTATSMTIYAAYASTESTQISIDPPQLSISLSPNTLFGGSGQKSTGTVTLSAPVRGQTGIVMSRTPASPSLFNTFPSQVIIPAGGSSGTFSFEAASPASATTITVTATLGTSASTLLVVYPGNPDLGPCKDCNAQGGHPINLTNGNVWLQQADYSLPGLGGGIQLVRTWNSLWLTNSPIEISGMFGHSWRSTYEERIAAGTTTRYWRSDGSVWQFQYNSGTQTYALVAPTDEIAALTFDSGTTLYTLTFHDGTKRIFNNSGYMTKIVDRNGNQTTVSYDGTNRITQVTDAAGRTLTFNYPNGSTRQVSSIQDSTGTVATYVYGTSSTLTKVTYADSSFNTFTYDTAAKLLDVKDTNAKILETHTYDTSRRGLTSERANGTEKVTIAYTSSTVTRVTDSQSNITDYTFQPIAARRWITQISGSGCVTCGGRGNQTFTFDFNGRLASRTDALSRTTSFTYDIFHNLTSRSVQLNPTTTLTWSYTYNGLGQVLTATDPMGNVTTNVYDTSGNLTSTTTPSPDGTSAGYTTSFTYDAYGQLTRITDPRSNPTDITYTAAGLIATVKDAQNNTTTYAYDARGNRTSVTDALNNTTTFTYNSMNRLTQITAPGTIVTAFAYDNRGRRTSVTDANNKTTTYAYDDSDRLTSVTDAASNVTAYAYDTENNLTSITDALSRTTGFAYDSRGRVTSVTFPSTLTESYTYDAVGNLLSKTDRDFHGSTTGPQLVLHSEQRGQRPGRIALANDLSTSVEL